MAVLPKHPDQHPHYNPKLDLTLDQLHRFTQAANRADQKREEWHAERPTESEAAGIETPAGQKPSREKTSAMRHAIGLIVLALIGLSIMYWSG